MPGLRRPGGQGLFPQLPGDRLQRLRPVRRRREVELLGSDISDWRITFVDTGLHTEIGERLRRVRPHLEERRDVPRHTTATCSPTPRWTTSSTTFRGADAVGVAAGDPPPGSFHVVMRTTTTASSGFQPARDLNMRDQRRVLRLPPGDLRLPRGGRGPRHATVPPGGRRGPDARLPVRRVLGADGHAQGARLTSRPLLSPVPARGPCGATSRRRPAAAASSVPGWWPTLSGSRLPDGSARRSSARRPPRRHRDRLRRNAAGAPAAARRVSVHCLVLTGRPSASVEARHAAADCSDGPTASIDVRPRLPRRAPARHWHESSRPSRTRRGRPAPDVVFAPRVDDSHQDHRLLGRAGADGLARLARSCTTRSPSGTVTSAA